MQAADIEAEDVHDQRKKYVSPQLKFLWNI